MCACIHVCMCIYSFVTIYTKEVKAHERNHNPAFCGSFLDGIGLDNARGICWDAMRRWYIKGPGPWDPEP